MNHRFLYIFNPDHDLALANNTANYMPSAPARRLSEDLALLPVWYAGEESLVLAPSTYNSAFLNEIRIAFPHLPDLLTEPEVTVTENLIPVPWGWNPSVRKRLSSLGIPAEVLPDQRQLGAIRKMSHRSLAVKVLADLQLNKNFCGESFYLTDSNDVRRFVENHTICLLKAPLSGSGKGLNWCKGIYTPPLSHWSEHVMKQQEGMVAEPVYDKVEDFAMQFYADTGKGVTFAGYSLFNTTASGAYTGNVLLPDEVIEQKLSTYVPLSSLHELRFQLEKIVASQLDGIYTGYLGVDMMICRFTDALQYRIHPCVEINLRMNMGMTARLFYNRYVRTGSKGMFRVNYFFSPAQWMERHLYLSKKYPLRMVDGKIIAGYLSLVPVTPKSQYSASVFFIT
ncbi:hypothetical protein EZS27_011899 [termite gut metagenome]|uniref:ATP-grasp domain-containing protein n=1 Tax=termite gut metagenome TaxID=433724 RepID=A0A5J4S421_9ZZZZ